MIKLKFLNLEMYPKSVNSISQSKNNSMSKLYTTMDIKPLSKKSEIFKNFIGISKNDYNTEKSYTLSSVTSETISDHTSSKDDTVSK